MFVDIGVSREIEQIYRPCQINSLVKGGVKRSCSVIQQYSCVVWGIRVPGDGYTCLGGITEPISGEFEVTFNVHFPIRSLACPLVGIISKLALRGEMEEEITSAWKTGKR